MSIYKSKNKCHKWVLAARPKTLSAALTPVVTATALAYAHHQAQWLPAILCMLFAIFMQIAANFINDLFDFRKGTDTHERLGPERACAKGWITPKEMYIGIAISLVLACSFGLGLLAYGGNLLIIVGILCVLFAFLYTTLLSYLGCGDILVYIFFGLVPVAGTYYVQTGNFMTQVWWLSAAIGLSTDTLLVLNNYRDRDTDYKSGKRTLIVVLGETFGQQFYLWQGILAAICAGFVLSATHWSHYLALAVYLLLHISTWKKMINIYKGRALNQILGMTSRNMLVLGVIIALYLFLSSSIVY